MFIYKLIDFKIINRRWIWSRLVLLTVPGISWGLCWFGTCRGPGPPPARPWCAEATCCGRCASRARANCAWWRDCESPGLPSCPPSPTRPVGRTGACTKVKESLAREYWHEKWEERSKETRAPRHWAKKRVNKLWWKYWRG